MDIATIEAGVKAVVQSAPPETFLFQLLAAYGQPKSNITRLQNGSWNSSKVPGEIIWKRQFVYRFIPPEQQADLHLEIDRLSKNEQIEKLKLRFVIVTDHQTILAVDTKTRETLDVALKDLHLRAGFFSPWAGFEKHKAPNESHADIRAAERMGKLYDQIRKDNPELDSHVLNVFLSRLLFCYFAEDTEIFPEKGMFTSAVDSYTQKSGSDLNAFLDRLFVALDVEDKSTYPDYIAKFPFVNGKLFSISEKAPLFSRQSRQLIIDCGGLDWSEINPDIFGSMMQAVMRKEHRGEIGMHYTSVSNIMKVIEPLFLNELRQEFEENAGNVKALEKLLERIYKIKVFDPACGSGNFLIIAYKELRKLEMQIYERLRAIHTKGALYLPRIALTQFAGIDLDDFAKEIAMLSE